MKKNKNNYLLQLKLQFLRLFPKYKKFRCKHCCIGCEYFKYCQVEADL